jgi:hypothetical protein
MNFESVMDVQARIMQEIFDFQIAGAVEALGLEAAPLPGAGMMAGLVNPRMAEAARTRRSFAPGDADLVAMGVAAKRGPDKDLTLPAKTGDFQLIVYCQKKSALKSDLVGRMVSLAKNEATVVYTGRVRRRTLQPWHRMALPKLGIGASIGHHRITAGTLGCFVKDRTTGKIGILSNNHVLANVNKGLPGDNILHPGPADGGTAAVAKLDRFVTIALGGAPNLVDCAYAELLPAAPPADRRPLKDSLGLAVGSLTLPTRAPAAVNDPVRKAGRTTGYSQGQVQAVGVNNLMVSMGTGSARFDGQMAIESLNGNSFSKGGDSGSIILDSNFRPIALLFAGSPSGGFDGMGLTFANPIDTVLNALKVDIVT